MGNSRWSNDHYDARARTRKATGTPVFAHTSDMRTVSPDKWKCHDTLNPKGVKVRESRDSDAHPESLGIMVAFDETGSMGIYPEEMQKDLKGLMSLLIQKGYVAHPQILFGAVGDAYSDRVPLQVGQFESGIEMEDNLSHFFLEGRGGGSTEESYDLALYFAARHTAMDCWEKRRKKGYLFLVGDEMPYSHVTPEQVQKLIGDKIQAPIPIEEMVREAEKTFHVFYVLAVTHYYGEDFTVQLDAAWRKLLGQRVLHLTKPAAISSTVALAIGQMEGQVDLATGLGHLKELGTDKGIVAATKKALENFSRSIVPATAPSLVAAAVPAGSGGSRIRRV